MGEEWRECNAVIRGTKLELSDHGPLTATVFIECQEGRIGFGQIGFDHLDPDDSDKWHPEGGACAYFLRRVLEVCGEDVWENLKGKVVRLKLEGNASGTRIVAMGHFMKDCWFFIDDMKIPQTYGG
jgi:hypothetical protein